MGGSVAKAILNMRWAHLHTFYIQIESSKCHGLGLYVYNVIDPGFKWRFTQEHVRREELSRATQDSMDVSGDVRFTNK